MTSKNNYAYEIRFVDDNIVQVFDIAAKRQQKGIDGGLNNSLLPHEYKQEDVLKGQLRYSKLLGSSASPTTSSTTTKGIFDDNDGQEPYQHHVVTKKSQNRRSTQRHTFFGMGGGGNGRGGPSSYYDFDYEEPITTRNNLQKDNKTENSNSNYHHHIDNSENSKSVMVVQEEAASAPPSPTPTPRLSSQQSGSPTIPSPVESSLPQKIQPHRTENIPVQERQQENSQRQLLQEPVAAVLPSSSSTYGKHAFIVDQNSSNSNQNMYNNNNNSYNNNNISLNQISPIPPRQKQQPFTPTMTTTAANTLQRQQQQYYTEEYTSMTMVDSNDYDSRKNLHQLEKTSSRTSRKKNKEGGCSCIIS